LLESRSRNSTRFGLTTLASERVSPRLIKECFASLECRVSISRLVEHVNLFILEVFAAWIDRKQKWPKTVHRPECGRLAITGKTIKLRPRMTFATAGFEPAGWGARSLSCQVTIFRV
jgi:flavin reductase (DIM6/NTAB) family NADH-FMN oxidoreductase RutF